MCWFNLFVKLGCRFNTMRSFPFWILAILLVISIHRTRTFDGCLCVEEIASDLELPVSLVNANDGSNRIFVAELKGVVSIVFPDGTKLPEPFIDVSSMSGYLGKYSNEGLTDIAFHPNFRANGLFYMLVTTPAKTKGIHHYSNLFEYKSSTTDKNKADPNYSRLVLQFDQPGPSHEADQVMTFLIVFFVYALLKETHISILNKTER